MRLRTRMRTRIRRWRILHKMRPRTFEQRLAAWQYRQFAKRWPRR